MNKSVTNIINIVLLIILFFTSAGTIIANKRVTVLPLIYLDPGHGGPDGGAVGADGTKEKDIVLRVSLNLKTYLENSGFQVKMTRSGDYDLAPNSSNNRKRDDIHKRCSLINNSDCLLFVSVHANKFSDKRIYGAQVFYDKHHPEAKELAETIQLMISDIMQNTKRIAKSIAGKYLIENAVKTGCLVEIGFLSNPDELILLKNESYQDKMAYAIYAGIISFLECNNKMQK
ncbi:MAG: N-acetylmuramoyl-L-alanine amidase [Bacilli bacterium]|nr:N-acetylmuramoyl-L-alanine amidase [Bacilli bacterium]MDD4077130.1 N-acetylmuramoyl-L-alanine amidase [Bacilli bacterium]MDD4388792.1 N-acetylmuramoyl-L-alanine amidase [Bacilli bacterium]